MFKKTLLGAAIATATMAAGTANAYVIGEPNDANVEVYGIVSISAVDYGSKKFNDAGEEVTEDGIVFENESRVGFRAAKAMTDDVEAFVQIESGWVLDEGAKLGNRDTFVGMRGDDWGSVRFGRMLTPMYELVDWPYSASNLSMTFDRGWRAGERFNFDRKSQMARYDSPFFSDVVKFSLAAGNGSSNDKDSNFFGGSISVTPLDQLTLHAAFELAEDTKFDTINKVDLIGDTEGYFAGFEFRMTDNWNLHGAYKTGDFEANEAGGAYREREIDAFSIQTNYYMGNMNFRLGYADQDGKTDKESDKTLDFTTVSGEFGYSFNSVYTFLRIAQHSGTYRTGNGYAGTDYDDLMVRVGTEWTF
ncbi:porin [Vibrio sonorensis]|uniref:porin n=1 Tax=Vibrio sonorensis TaxID=1004316 RepID=UPI0008D9B4D0|nr:porin [Vibrio sonorensis]